MTWLAHCVQLTHGRWMKGALDGDGLLGQDHHAQQGDGLLCRDHHAHDARESAPQRERRKHRPSSGRGAALCRLAARRRVGGTPRDRSPRVCLPSTTARAFMCFLPLFTATLVTDACFESTEHGQHDSASGKAKAKASASLETSALPTSQKVPKASPKSPQSTKISLACRRER